MIHISINIPLLLLYIIQHDHAVSDQPNIMEKSPFTHSINCTLHDVHHKCLQLHLRFPRNTHTHTRQPPHGWACASCAHTRSQRHQRGTERARRTTSSGRAASHLSPIPDMLIPAVEAGRRGGDRLEVSVSRCAHAVGPCQKTAIREGFGGEQLLFLGGLEGRMWKGLLIRSCHLSASLGWH